MVQLHVRVNCYKCCTLEMSLGKEDFYFYYYYSFLFFNLIYNEEKNASERVFLNEKSAFFYCVTDYLVNKDTQI